MRRVTITLLASGLSAVLMFTWFQPNAGAIVPVPCYHPTTICVAAFRFPGNHHLQLLITGPKDRYFRRYRLCVKAPDGSLACDVFRVAQPKHRNFFSMVTWNRHFPDHGPGHYSARWRRLPDHRLVGKSGFPVG